MGLGKFPQNKRDFFVYIVYLIYATIYSRRGTLSTQKDDLIACTKTNFIYDWKKISKKNLINLKTKRHSREKNVVVISTFNC